MFSPGLIHDLVNEVFLKVVYILLTCRVKVKNQKADVKLPPFYIIPIQIRIYF